MMGRVHCFILHAGKNVVTERKGGLPKVHACCSGMAQISEVENDEGQTSRQVAVAAMHHSNFNQDMVPIEPELQYSLVIRAGLSAYSYRLFTMLKSTRTVDAAATAVSVCASGTTPDHWHWHVGSISVLISVPLRSRIPTLMSY